MLIMKSMLEPEIIPRSIDYGTVMLTVRARSRPIWTCEDSLTSTRTYHETGGVEVTGTLINENIDPMFIFTSQ